MEHVLWGWEGARILIKNENVICQFCASRFFLFLVSENVLPRVVFSSLSLMSLDYFSIFLPLLVPSSFFWLLLDFSWKHLFGSWILPRRGFSCLFYFIYFCFFFPLFLSVIIFLAPPCFFLTWLAVYASCCTF